MDKILVVDDDPAFLKDLRRGLRKYESQFEPLMANSVDDAVRMLQSDTISVVISDLAMPHPNGLDLLSVIQNHYPNLPCVLLTESDASGFSHPANEETAIPLLRKPVNEHSLAAAIIDAMDRRDEGRVPKRIALHLLLQLIGMEGRSCAVEVNGRAGRKGTFVLQDGMLLDARNRDETGEAAAMEMLRWGEVSFRFRKWNGEDSDAGLDPVPLSALLQRWNSDDRPGAAPEGANEGQPAGGNGTVGKGEMLSSGGKSVKVLVVDDSRMMRRAVCSIIEPIHGLHVIGEASNGEEALDQISRFRPDVVTLDVEMPLMDGITTLKHMMIQAPTPTVMLSSLTREGSKVTFDALRFGAVDFLTKPSNLSSDGIRRQSEELVRRVKLAAAVELDSVQYIRASAASRKSTRSATDPANEIHRIVGIGAAEGGPGSLLKLIPGIPPDRPTSYLAIVYMAPEFVGAFAEYLDQHSRLRVRRAVDGMRVESGHAYLASGQEYMTADKEGADLLLRVHPAPFAKRRGSINMMLFAIADAVGSGSAGLLLSGAGRDGSEGLEEIIRVGGIGTVLSPVRCMYKEMVNHAIHQCGERVRVAERGTAEELEQLLS